MGCVVSVYYAKDVEYEQSDKTETQALVSYQHIQVAFLKGEENVAKL